MPRLKIWFAFLGGALAWTLHLMGTYIVSETACRAEMIPGGQAVLFSTLFVLTIGCLIISYSSFQTGRRLSGDRSEGSDGVLFLSRTSQWSNVFFIAVILAQTLPLFMGVHGC